MPGATSLPDSVVNPGRLSGLDALRGAVIVQVVLHHAVLGYCQFGHFDRRHYLWSSAPIVDTERWLGFDVIVLFNDSYFMPLMFLLSGLFVWPSLSRKGPVRYLAGRFRRLGLPFAVAVLTIIPLAYYPSFRMTGAATGFGPFWVGTLANGPWPAGPPWFLAVLLGFDVLAAAGAAVFRRFPLRAIPDPLRSFPLLAAVSALVFLPPLVGFGPSRWLEWGPLTVQASRVLLYAAYFAVGLRAGAGGLPLRLPRAGLALALATFALLVAVQVTRIDQPKLLLPLGWLLAYGLTFALFCAAATQASVAVALRFTHRHPAWESLAANAFGIYLLHYPFVVWGQYALLDQPLGAVPKAVLVFAGSLACSWTATAGLRRLGVAL